MRKAQAGNEVRMIAVVMAGGEGSRLRPLTSRLPKPLASIANKPVMHHIVDLLRRHGITEIIATLHYLADEVEAYFGDGGDLGVTMHYVVEDSPLGTAGAVRQAAQLIGNGTFLIISGDALTDLDLTAIVEHHRNAGNFATIVLQRVNNPLEFGVVVTGESGRIERFLEKPSWGEVFSDTINTGIYVLEPEIFNYMEPGKVYDFSKDIFPQLLRDGKQLGGYIATDYWTDIGTLEQYHQANVDALTGRVRIEVPGTEVQPGVWCGEGTQIAPDARVNAPAILGKNCSVEGGAVIEACTVLGDSAIVARNAHVNRVVAWKDVYIGESAQLNGCTIADRAIIKDRVTVGEGSVIGSGCVIGSGALVRGNLKLWPDKAIASGAIVSMSLIYGTKWPGSLFGNEGVSGLANVEITPEFAMKLGHALGSSLNPGQTVMTSRDTHPASRVTNRCVISGLLSVGIHVEDLRAYPIPLSRYAISVGGDAGVHTRISPKDANAFLIEFFDHNGINVDKATERKIEGLFFREDFRRTPMDKVGTLDFPSRSLERYSAAFLSALQPKAIAEAGFKVVIDYAYGNASTVLPRIMGNLGVEIIALNAYFDDEKTIAFRANRPRHLRELGRIVSTLQANLGILVDHDGETLALVDDRGRVIDAERLLALVTLLVVRNTTNARIAVPVTIPRAIEAIAQSHNATVIRSRSDRRSTMALAHEEGRALDFAGGSGYELIFPEFHPAFDALYAAAKILELLGAEHRSLSELVDQLPSWYLASRSVAVPWERKGEVMRTLFDEQKGNGIEMIDGIRVNRNGGWILVLPDASDPTVNVYAEGTSVDEAGAFVEEFAHRIEQLVNA
jgi:mannose-1-phosphate guanylyltransferase / phosphomannomutase